MSKKAIPNFLPMMLGDAVLAKRTSDELTLRSAAASAQVDHMALYRMEVGADTPTLNNYYRVCKWLDKPMDAFFIKPKTEKK